MRCRWGAVAEHRPVHDRLPVDRVGHGLPYERVVEGWLGVVRRQDRLAFGRSHENLEGRVRLELGQVLGCGVSREHVHVPGQHRREGRRRVRDEAERGLRKRRRLAPVGVGPHQLHPVALDPLAEAEGSGTDRTGGVVVRRLGRDDDRVAPGEVEGQRAVGLRQRHLHRERIDHRHVRDLREQRLLRVGRVLARARSSENFTSSASKVAAVMEGHSIVQPEGVDQPVLRHLPALGEVRATEPSAVKRVSPSKTLR
jgi:hypothetical protein